MENFILYDELGGGSTSIVYKGRQKGNLNYVALKCSDKVKKPEITNHVRLSQDLDHPNIVRFHEWYETKKHLWVVVELCTGGSLESVVNRDACLPEGVVRKFGWDLVKGLQHIHKLGIIFSDLTPTKILLDSSGILKFSNFCHSKTVRETLEDFFSLCSSCEEEKYKYEDMKKRFQGSPIYMAPEVLQGSETTFISDLWALGCILYYMYTGKPPFFSANHNELTGRILHEEPSSPMQTTSPTILPSQSFQNLLRALLIKKPDERIKWPELLSHQFWTQAQKKEDDLEEYDDDDEFTDRNNGRDSGDSAVWGHRRIPDTFPLGGLADKCPYNEMASTSVTKSLEKSTSSRKKTTTTNRPGSKTDTHTVHGTVRNSQESARKLAEPRKGNPSNFSPKSDMDDNSETISLLSSCETSRGSWSITDSLNCSPPQASDIHGTGSFHHIQYIHLPSSAMIWPSSFHLFE